MLALGGIAALTIMPRLMGTSASKGADEEEQTVYGVTCSLLSALFYAMHTVRLSSYGSVDATVQATGQVVVNALLDVLALPFASIGGLGGSTRKWLRRADRAALERLAYAAAWNGVMIVGATTWAMSYAQRYVRASSAALCYAMEPLFAAVFAALVLDDHFGSWQVFGGVLVVSANVIAGLLEREA